MPARVVQAGQGAIKTGDIRMGYKEGDRSKQSQGFNGVYETTGVAMKRKVTRRDLELNKAWSLQGWLFKMQISRTDLPNGDQA
jgi:hypothetical protein